MPQNALKQMYATSRSLPGGRRELCRVVYAPTPGADREAEDGVRAKQLRRRTAELIRLLAANAEKPLLRAVEHATNRWDQMDAVYIVTPLAKMDLRELQHDWRTLISEVPAASEAGVEALAVLDAAFGVARLLERNLASFIRSRLRDGAPLKIDERPFLDAATALLETAEAFS